MQTHTRLTATIAAVTLLAGLALAEKPGSRGRCSRQNTRSRHGRRGDTDRHGGPGAGKGGPLANMIRGHIGRIMALSSKLDITPEQKEKIREVVRSYRADMKPVAKRVMQAHRTLGDAITTDSPSEDTIRQAADNLGAVTGDAAVMAAGIVAEVRAVLTAEQIERLEQFKADKRDAADEWFDKRHRR